MKRISTNIILLVGLLGPLACLSCQRPAPLSQRDERVRVRVVQLQEDSIRFSVRTSGTLSSRKEMKLSFKTGGIVRSMRVNEGETVGKGTEMASLDLSEIRAEVTKARLALDKAMRDYTRAGNLYRDTVATLEQYQNARTALDIARSNRDIAEFNLSHSVISAPADGRVLKKLVEVNEMVAPGYPVFLFASTESEWVVRVSLTDRDIVRISPGDSASIRFDAFPNGLFPGNVSETGKSADPYTGTFEVEISLGETPVNLVSGLVARAELFTAASRAVLRIPASSLVVGTGLEGTVYVIEEGRPVRREISLETITDAGLLVRKGLAPGEMLVVEGAQYITENSRIEIVPEE